MARSKAVLNAEWLAKAQQTLEMLRSIYGFDTVDVHAGPISVVRSVNISWTAYGRLSYISIALPTDEVQPHEYSDALARLLYGE